MRPCPRAADVLEVGQFETRLVAAFLPRSFCPQSVVGASSPAVEAIFGLKPGKSVV